MKGRDRAVHGIEDRSALLTGKLGNIGVPENAPFHVIHHIEDTADDIRILAQDPRPRHRHPTVLVERRDDTIFPLHLMGGRQQRPRWFATQHQPAPGCIRQQIGGVGLAAAELSNRKGRTEIRDPLDQIFREPV